MTRSRILAAAAIVATVVLGAQTWHKAFRPGGNDFTSYLLSARALWDGQSPYGLDTPFPYIYPLTLAFAVGPLVLLPYGAAVIGWFAASVAALGAILRRWAFGSELAIAAAVIVTFNIIQNNLLNGQVNFFVVLCCLMSIDVGRVPPSPMSTDVGRVPPSPGTVRGGPVIRARATAGLWLGAAIALKLMPVVLVVYFLVRRRYRAILVAGVTALVLALAPALLMSGSGFVESGFLTAVASAEVVSRITAIYAQYARELLIPMMTSPAGDTSLAYSVASVVQRALGVTPALWIDVLCALAVLGTIAAIDARIWRRQGNDLAAAAAYLAAIVLISPKSETHHLAFAIPAVALGFAWFFGEISRAARVSASFFTWALGLGPWALFSAAAAIVAAPFTGAAEGPMITAAMILLIAAVTQLPTSCIQQQA